VDFYDSQKHRLRLPKKEKGNPFFFFYRCGGNNKLEDIWNENILPDELLERKNLSEELENKIKEIPDLYRLILLMRYKDDLTLQEIAEVLDKPYNTVKSQHQRALATLRKKLSDA
jgi:RNA polymerase sigma-70 factor (ECF subfamily)